MIPSQAKVNVKSVGTISLKTWLAIKATLFAMMTFLAKPIVYILFGSGYLESVNILKIYIWSSIGLFLGTAINQYLIAENLVKTIFALNLFLKQNN